MSKEESNETQEAGLLKHLMRIEKRLDALAQRMERVEEFQQNLQGDRQKMSIRTQAMPPPLPKTSSFSPAAYTEVSLRKSVPDYSSGRADPSAERVKKDRERSTTWNNAAAETAPVASEERRGTKAAATAYEEVTWSVPLRRWGLLPPADSGSFEVQVGAWWATRVGTLLAVIGVVFFGIYITQGTPPWVKWIQLFAVSGAITFMGWRLEKKFETFGAVVFGGGLSLLYFTAFSAYAVPPVKVVENMALAGILQGAAIIFIVVCSLWRNSRTLAALAIFFGFVTCFFSSYAKMDEFALLASLLLAGGGVFFFLKKQWGEPLQVAVPLAYLLYAWVYAFVWQPSWHADGTIPSLFPGLGYLILCFGLFVAADYVSLVRNRLMPPGNRRLLQMVNKAGATFLGFAFVTAFFRENLSFFFFLYSFIFLAVAFAYFLRAQTDEMTSIHAASGAGLFSLGLIQALDAYTLWISLAVQSMLLLLGAQRTGLKVLKAGTSLVWITSVIFFAWDVIPGDFLTVGALTRETSSLLSIAGAASVAFFLFSAFLLCLWAKWLHGAAGGTKMSLSNLAGESLTAQGNLVLLKTTLLGLVGLLIAAFYFPVNFFSFGACLAVVLLVMSGVAFRHWIPFLAAGIPFLFAHANLWSPAFPEAPPLLVWLNGGSLLALSVLAGLAVYRDERYLLPAPGEADSPGSKILLFAPHLLWIFSLQVLFYKLFSVELYLFLAVGVSLLLTAAAHRLPFRGLADLSPVPIALAAGGFLGGHLISFPGPEGVERLPGMDNLWLLWPAVAGAFLFACFQGVSAVLRANREVLSAKVGEGLSTALATALGLFALWVSFSGSNLMAAAAGLAIGVAALSRWPGLKAAFFSAAIFLLFAHATFYALLLAGRGDSAGTAYLVCSLVLAVLTIAYVLRTAHEKQELAVPLQWLFGSLTLALLFFLFLTRGGGLEPYVTVFWGLSATALFLVGLLAKMKSLRVIGLVGLALSLPRIFLIDIQSALYRIVAFGVIGAVLMGVGFLYHKYKEVISSPSDADA